MNEKSELIVCALLRGMLSGVYQSGARIPKETELAESFDTNRMNAHRAVSFLEGKGFVLRKKRVGSVVASPLDAIKARGLLIDLSKRVRVLYSTNPHYIHWDETSFKRFEETVVSEGYSVSYETIPESRRRSDLERILRDSLNDGVGALVIFPDMNDTGYLLENADLIGDSIIPVYMLNRSGEPMPFVRISEVSMDPLGEGAFVGRLLKDRKGARVLFYGDEKEPFWANKRYQGLVFGLTRSLTGENTVRRYSSGDETALSQLFDHIIASKQARSGDGVEISEKNGRGEERQDYIVVAVNNAYAAEFIDSARKRDLKPPDDYQLVAFDNNPLYLSYDLTSMAQPFEEIGEVFGKMVVDCSWPRDYRGKISVKVSSYLLRRGTFL